MIKKTLICDICGKELKDLYDKTRTKPKTVGGMTGFYKREQPDDNGIIKEVLLQYNFDFCEECNKKMVNFYFSLGGK